MSTHAEPATQSAKRSRLSGFTLVELLVVIAILTLLAGMLLPVLRSALELSRTAECLSIQKQHAVVLALYGDEQDGYFPVLLDSVNTYVSIVDGQTYPTPDHFWAGYWEPVRSYFPKQGPWYDDWQKLKAEPPPHGHTCSAAFTCPAFVRRYDGGMFGGDYNYRPPRKSYASAGDRTPDQHAWDSEKAGKRRIAKLPRPTRYYFLSDIGFTSDLSALTAFDKSHLSGWNAAFLDGHAKTFAITNYRVNLRPQILRDDL